jgi:hypothetical protein
VFFSAHSVVVRLLEAIVCGMPLQPQAAQTSAEIANETRIEDVLKALPSACTAADPLWRDQANAVRCRLSSFRLDGRATAVIKRSVGLGTFFVAVGGA